MFKTKYQYQPYMEYDFAGIEEHLEKMEAKGWRLEKIVDPYLWKYQKVEPAKVKYSLVHAPRKSKEAVWNGELEAYCREAGWWKVESRGDMRIFRSDNPENVPIETDERVRLSFISRSMIKCYLMGMLIVVFALLVFYLLIKNTLLERNPIRFFADTSMTWSMIYITFFVLYGISNLVYAFCWLSGAKKAVAKGQTVPRPKGYIWLSRVGLFGNAVLMLVWMFSMSVPSALELLWYSVFAFLLNILVLVLWEFFEYNKIVGVLILLVAAGLLSFGTTKLMDFCIEKYENAVEEKREPVAYYNTYPGKEYNKEYPLYRDTLPLTTKDLFTTSDARYPEDANTTYEVVEERSSLLLTYKNYKQRSYLLDSNTPGIYYQMVEVKAGFLYDFFLDMFLKNPKKEIQIPKKDNAEYQLQETFLGADISLYRLCSGENGYLYNDWLLLTDSRMIQISSETEFSIEQLRIAAEKLVK